MMYLPDSQKGFAFFIAYDITDIIILIVIILFLVVFILYKKKYKK